MKEWLFDYNLYYFSCNVQGYNTLEYYSLFKVCDSDLSITYVLLTFLIFLFLIFSLKILKFLCVISNRVINCYVFKGSIWGFWGVTKSANYFFNLVLKFPIFTNFIQTFISFLTIFMTGSLDPMSVI